MKILFNVAASMLLLLLAAGCETESSDQISISISPNHTKLRRGESREFTASGWQDYTWSLSNREIGVLSNNKGESTTYTVFRSPATTNEVITQILTVTVDVASEGGGTGTNQASSLVSAQALIEHQYTP